MSNRKCLFAAAKTNELDAEEALESVDLDLHARFVTCFDVEIVAQFVHKKQLADKFRPAAALAFGQVDFLDLPQRNVVVRFAAVDRDGLLLDLDVGILGKRHGIYFLVKVVGIFRAALQDFGLML